MAIAPATKAHGGPDEPLSCVDVTAAMVAVLRVGTGVGVATVLVCRLRVGWVRRLGVGDEDAVCAGVADVVRGDGDGDGDVEACCGQIVEYGTGFGMALSPLRHTHPSVSPLAGL